MYKLWLGCVKKQVKFIMHYFFWKYKFILINQLLEFGLDIQEYGYENYIQINIFNYDFKFDSCI